MLLNAQWPRRVLLGEKRPASYWEKANVEFGWTVAHYAAGKGHVRLLQELAMFGVDLWTPGTGGRTPAHWAATNGHDNCLAYLLDRQGADVNASNNSGWALVHCAACQNHVSCMTLLLEKGADPAITNNKGETARGATRSNKVRQVIDRFIARAASGDADKPTSTKKDEPQQESWDAGITRGRQGTAPQGGFKLNAKAVEFLPRARRFRRPTDTDLQEAMGAVKIAEKSPAPKIHTAASAMPADKVAEIRAKRREERARRKASRQQQRG